MEEKLVIISDLHCGSIYGLVPPQYQTEYKCDDQKESWNNWLRITKKWKNPDYLLVNGDCIEGSQTRQGGAELITPDRNVQVEMAKETIELFRAKRIIMTYGTAYHTGQNAEDFEYNLAALLRKNARVGIEGRAYFKVGGATIDARHKIGTSAIPHGRATALLREVMWSLIGDGDDGDIKADIIIRSHAHYHIWVEDSRKTAFITPGLQLKKGRYGSREMSGSIDWGAIRLTIKDGKIIEKEKDICRLNANKPKLIRIE